MPTHDELPRFRNELHHLNRQQLEQFRVACAVFIRCLGEAEAAGGKPPDFLKSLGVKRMVDRGGIWELAWSGDGRCTWEYGTPVQQGRFHVIWRRIGGHDIYNDP